jgi:hypothetical protein
VGFSGLLLPGKNQWRIEAETTWIWGERFHSPISTDRLILPEARHVGFSNIELVRNHYLVGLSHEATRICGFDFRSDLWLSLVRKAGWWFRQ